MANLHVTAKQILAYHQDKLDVRLLLKNSVDADLKTVLNDVPSQEPLDMLEALKEHILNHTTAKLDNYKSKLLLLQWNNKKQSFSEFTKEHEAPVTDIINMGHPITWDERSLDILRKLPEPYFDFGANLKMQKNVGTLKIKDMATRELRTDHDIYKFIKSQIKSLEETRKLKNLDSSETKNQKPAQQAANFTSNEEDRDLNNAEPTSHYNNPRQRKKHQFKRKPKKQRYKGTCGY